MTTHADTRQLHPLIAAAAGGVLVASLAATAAITGLLPTASSRSAPTTLPQTIAASQSAANPAVTAPAAPQQALAQTPIQPSTPQQATPAPSSVQASRPNAGKQSEHNAQATPHAPTQAAVCASCGTVESVVPVRRTGHSTGLGAVGGALAGGVVGNQFGGGGGRTAMTLLGALGGGLAGNSAEKHLRSETHYQVRIRMETGKRRYFTYRQAPTFQKGEHVRIRNGSLAHMG